MAHPYVKDYSIKVFFYHHVQLGSKLISRSRSNKSYENLKNLQLGNSSSQKQPVEEEEEEGLHLKTLLLQGFIRTPRI